MYKRQFLNYPVNTIWVRDYGPEFAMDTSGERYIFDAFYSGRPLDDQVPILMGGGDWLNSDGSPLEVNTNEHGLSGGNVMSDHPGLGFTDVFAAVLPTLDFSAGVHVNYGETVLRIKDGLPKFKDFPTEFGGSGEMVPE